MSKKYDKSGSISHAYEQAIYEEISNRETVDKVKIKKSFRDKLFCKHCEDIKKL